jgi:hypothetical protein
MESRLFASRRAKIATVGVMAIGALSGAACAEALPGSVQSGVADLADNVGLSVPNGQGPTLAPLGSTTTTSDNEGGQVSQKDDALVARGVAQPRAVSSW